MNSTIERLLTLRVKDVMHDEVITIPSTATLAVAAKILADNEISGAPVVDSLDQCVGVISNTDFALRESKHIEVDSQIVGQLEYVFVSGANGEPCRIEPIADNLVSDHMTRVLYTIDPNATLTEASRYMCAKHIHRLIVLDDHKHPIGIITALDIVSANLKAVEE